MVSSDNKEHSSLCPVPMPHQTLSQLLYKKTMTLLSHESHDITYEDQEVLPHMH